MKKIIYFADIQDIWLFNYFLEDRKENTIIIYEKTGKITSPHLWVEDLKKLSPSVYRFEGIESDSFNTLMKECDWFITKDNLPFIAPHSYTDKIISISWVGESVNRSCKTKNLTAGFHRFYVEKQLTELCHLRGFSNAVSSTPKYYFLNRFNRTALCHMLGLDPAKRFVTLFTNHFFNIDKRVKKILQHITDFCQQHEYELILKNKLKQGDYSKDLLRHDHFFRGEPKFYHPGVMLQAISEFSLGFSSSAAIESEIINGRFISFWKHPYISLEDTKQAVIENGASYRLARSDNTFNVCTNHCLSDILEQLGSFLNASTHTEEKYVEIDSFLEQVKNG